MWNDAHPKNNGYSSTCVQDFTTCVHSCVASPLFQPVLATLTEKKGQSGRDQAEGPTFPPIGVGYVFKAEENQVVVQPGESIRQDLDVIQHKDDIMETEACGWHDGCNE